MKKLSLRVKLISSMLIIGLIPFILISVITLINTEKSLKHAVEIELGVVRDLKADGLNQYINTITSQIKLVAANNATLDAFERFNDAFQYYPVENPVQNSESVKSYWVDQFATKYQAENQQPFKTDSYFNALSPKAIQLQADFISNNPQPLGNKNALVDLNNQTTYSNVHSKYHPWFDQYLNEFGYYDIFLVNLKGEVIYSVFKELDFATSLNSGPWAKSGLAEAFNKGKNLQAGETYFTDLALYAPSYDAPAGFASSPIYKDGSVEGVLVFQMPLERITKIMSQRSGLGETGESYLIGSDKLMRSDSYLDPDGHSVVNSFRYPEKGMVETLAADLALSGKAGVQEIIDYNGNPVLSSYKPIQFGEHQWAIIVEIDVAEAFASVYELELLVLLIGALGIAFISIMGYLIASSIAKPILALSNQMEMVGRNFDFSKTLVPASQDEVGKATEAFNGLLSNTKRALSEVDVVLDKMAAGDLHHRIKADLKGDLATLKNSTNRSVDSVEKVLNEIRTTVSALKAGNFGHSVEIVGEGVYRDILSVMEESFSAMKLVVTDINLVMHSMNQGDFSGSVTAEANGDFDTLKQSINGSLANMADAIQKISEVVAAQAAGDLTKELPSGHFKGQLHDLKNAINYSSSKVKEVVDVAIDSSNVVTEAAMEVSQGAHDLSSRVQEQAAALEQTSATMEEMSSQVDSNSQNAISAATKAATMKQQAHEGMSVMERTIEAMGSIEESSQKISEIVTLIDSIAFQTNLLALNAAVEAARAGEHGRGFAVVAGEVRNLAQKSADAAKDIKGLVTETVDRVSQGSSLARNSGDTLKEMNLSVEEVGEMLDQISRASKEQSEGLYQVNQAISQIDNVTQQNAALVEETTAASESLKDQASVLREEMLFFNTGSEHVIQKQRVEPQKTKAVKTPELTISKPTAAASKGEAVINSMSQVEKPVATSKVNATSSHAADDSDEWSDF